MIFKSLSKEAREWLFRVVFGEWKERAELHSALFPKPTYQQPASAMSQLVNRGKGGDEIDKLLGLLLAVVPWAGVANLRDAGEDQAVAGEFRTDVEEFRKNAQRYLRRNDWVWAVERIRATTDAISSVARAAKADQKDLDVAERIVSVLWSGIIELLRNMEEMPFAGMKELAEPLCQALADSAGCCRQGIPEKVRTALSEKMGGLWKHALLGEREARESFKIHSHLMGKEIPASVVETFCSGFRAGEKKRPPPFHRRSSAK